MTFGPTGGRVAIWDGTGQRLVDELAGHGRPLAYAAVSPDGKALLTSSDDGTVSAWRLVASTATARTPLTTPARVMRYVASNELLVTGGMDRHGRRVRDSHRERIRGLGTKVDGLFDSLVETTPDGKTLAVVAPGKELQLWDPRTGAVAKRFALNGVITRIGASHDGNRISATTASSLHVWDVATANRNRNIPAPRDHERQRARGLPCRDDAHHRRSPGSRYHRGWRRHCRHREQTRARQAPGRRRSGARSRTATAPSSSPRTGRPSSTSPPVPAWPP